MFQRTLMIGALVIGLALCASAQTASAQTAQCGIANAVSFPVDPNQFRIVQDFGSPSPLDPGKYDTGEDWYGGRNSAGTPVHAIANGQVTYATNNGWGVDGGVIIISHAMPDGSTAYSMYGGVTAPSGGQLPSVYSCVSQGDVIAAVGDPRPAPHLHFEIRTNQPDTPGAGYDSQDPVLDGWRRPSKFVDNWQAWSLKSTLWHADIADEAGPIAPPVKLDDNSLVLLDANRVLRVSNDGRVLWRVILQAPAVGLAAEPSGVLIAYASGKMQLVSADGSLGESWQDEVTLDSAPMTVNHLLIFHTPNNTLTAFSPDGHAALWQTSNIPPILRWSATSSVLGLMTDDNAMLTVSLQGQLINRASLREPGSLIADGSNLIAYTRGGLWQVASDGTWLLNFPDAPPGGRTSAVAENDQQVFLFDSTSLHAYDLAHTPQWATLLPGVSGTISLSVYNDGGVVLLTSTHGDIIAVQASSGGVCNTTRIYGSSRSREWHDLGSDGVLRVYVADQIIGLNWQKFLMACAQPS